MYRHHKDAKYIGLCIAASFYTHTCFILFLYHGPLPSNPILYSYSKFINQNLILFPSFRLKIMHICNDAQCMQPCMHTFAHSEEIV